MFRFTTGRTIPDSNCFNAVLFYQFHQLATCQLVFRLWRMRIDGFIVQQSSLCIQTYDLTSGTESRIDAQYPFLSQRRGKEQLAKVTCKDPDGFIVGFLFA